MGADACTASLTLMTLLSLCSPCTVTQPFWAQFSIRAQILTPHEQINLNSFIAAMSPEAARAAGC